MIPTLVRGSTGSLASVALLGESFALDAVISAFFWYERVPSYSNPADPASRLKSLEMVQRVGAEQVEPVWPGNLKPDVSGGGVGASEL